MTALGVLCCFALFVCLPLLASFFLPSHLSLKHVCSMHICVHVHALTPTHIPTHPHLSAEDVVGCVFSHGCGEDEVEDREGEAEDSVQS